MPHRLASQGAGSDVGGSRGARPTYVSNGSRTDAVSFQEDPRGGRWEHSQQSHPAQQTVYARRAEGDVHAGGGGRGGGGAGSGRFAARPEGVYDARHGSARNSHGGSAGNERASEAVATEEPFGVMAPCWRLLERAKSYMDQVIGSAGIFFLIG